MTDPDLSPGEDEPGLTLDDDLPSDPVDVDPGQWVCQCVCDNPGLVHS